MLGKNEKLADQIREMAEQGNIPGVAAGSQTHDRLRAYLDPEGGGGPLESVQELGSRSQERPRFGLEAIVRIVGRPPLLVQNGTFVLPDNASEVVPQDTLDFIENELDAKNIDPVISKAGRIELIDIPGVPFVGSGWIIEKPSETEAIIITNRHVASEFARSDGRGGYRFRTAPNFRPYEAEIDFLREYENPERKNLALQKILYIASAREPDIALLRVSGEQLRGVMEIELETKEPDIGQKVAVVGYPAYDSRNNASAMANYFHGIFNVKRFAFGEISGVSTRYPEIIHDATTLGGNSGSVVFDPDTGKALGLHFSGEFEVANYAVDTKAIGQALSGLTTQVVVRDAEKEAVSDGVKPVEFYRGREGYRDDFLGSGEKNVPLPCLGHWRDDVASVVDADGGENSHILKYENFSVVMSKSRKLPIITAVNINGALSKRVGRIDRWYVDGRLDEVYQTGNEAYKYNSLDRGHMVRREDPVWGTLEQAKRANIDTFHYTNAAPQHSSLNQKDWLRLEDYVLANARTHDLKVSVFTGPVLRKTDRLYRDVVKLPEDYWKVAVVVDSRSKNLSATAYVLTQGEMIKNVTESFVFGGFRTYQVPLAVISEQTGLDFTALEQFDPMVQRRQNEGVAGTIRNMFLPISSSDDVWLFN